MIRERDLAAVNISQLNMAFIYEAMCLISVCRSSSYLSLPNQQPVEHDNGIPMTISIQRFSTKKQQHQGLVATLTELSSLLDDITSPSFIPTDRSQFTTIQILAVRWHLMEQVNDNAWVQQQQQQEGLVVILTELSSGLIWTDTLKEPPVLRP